MQKLSESMREQITAAQERITAAQAEIGQLMSSQQARHPAIQLQIKDLQRQIAGSRSVIGDNQRKLPMQEKIEAAHDRMVAKFAADEQAQEAAERETHDQAVKAAALAEWLKVPGQTEQGFNAAWGQIANQIATQRAVTAGAAESGAPHGQPLKQAAADVLKARYGG